MSIQRRKKIGKSLLIAGVGASMTIGCNRRSVISGNLMPPPAMALCIAVEPGNAKVLVNQYPVENEGCMEMDNPNTVLIEAKAEGYRNYREEIYVGSTMQHVIEMVPEERPEEPASKNPEEEKEEE